MGTIDIVIIVILVMFLLIGFFKGFIRQILSFANLLLAIVLAFLCVNPVSVALSGTSVATKINTEIEEFISSKGEAFNIVIEEGTTDEVVQLAVDQLGLPDIIDTLLVKVVKIDESSYGMTLSDLLSEKIGGLVLIALTFLALVIVIFIIMKIIIHFIDALINKSKALSGINKFLGLVLGLVKGVVIVSLLMLALSAISGVISSVNDFLIADLNIGSEGFGLGKFFYEKNPIIWLFENVIDIDKILSSLKPTPTA